MSKDTPKPVYFFPNLDPTLPPLSIEAASQDEAIRLYEQQIKQQGGDAPARE